MPASKQSNAQGCRQDGGCGRSIGNGFKVSGKVLGQNYPHPYHTYLPPFDLFRSGCVCLLPSIAAISFAGAALGSRGLAVAPHPFNGWILAQANLHHCTLANLIHCIPHASVPSLYSGTVTALRNSSRSQVASTLNPLIARIMVPIPL